MLLTIKSQYRNFESGEFVNEKEQTYEEAILIIKSFPWAEQHKDHLEIGFTNPSVTLHYGLNYLKLALYFNNKFVLYFFNGKTLYKKSFVKLEQSISFIQYFFQTGTIEFKEFKKERIWGLNVKKHFISKNFVYRIDNKNPFHYADWFTISNSVLWLLFLCFFSTKFDNVKNTGTFTALIISCFFMSGPNLILLFDYYILCRQKVLILSKGNPVFYFGDIGSEKEYRKEDIITVTIKRNNTYKCLWSNFCLSFIFFKNGDEIVIPSLFVNEYEMMNKMRDFPCILEKVYYPYLSPGYRILS